MKVVNHVTYIDTEKIAAIRPVHRTFIAKLGSEGLVAAAGPFTDGSGSLFIYETDSLDEAERIFAQDPYSTGGVVVRHEMRVWQLINAYPGLFEIAQ